MAEQGRRKKRLRYRLTSLLQRRGIWENPGKDGDEESHGRIKTWKSSDPVPAPLHSGRGGGTEICGRISGDRSGRL